MLVGLENLVNIFFIKTNEKGIVEEGKKGIYERILLEKDKIGIEIDF